MGGLWAVAKGDHNLKRTSLSEQVGGILRDELKTRYQPGERIEAESRLAARFGVSVNVIREALAKLVHAGLIERRQGSGTYVSDPALSRHVGILIELDISDPRVSTFFIRTVQELRNIFEQNNLRTRVYMGRTKPATLNQKGLTCPEFIEDLENDKLLGVATVATLPYPDWVSLTQRKRVPVVAGDSGQGRYTVLLDYAELIGQAVRYLVGKGRRRLAAIGTEAFDARLVREAFRAHGVAINEDWLRLDLPEYEQGAAWSAFAGLWSSGERPDGLIVTDDMLFAETAMAILDRQVRVPDELMVATHANRGALTHYPFPTARLELDADEFARRIGEMLLSVMAGREPARPHDVLPCRLVDENGIDGIKMAKEVESDEKG